MPARKNLVGCVFERWTVLEYAGPGTVGATWRCRCECGTERVVNANSLMAGTSASCGCFASEMAGATHTIHGHNSRTRGQSPTYISWRSMLKRCNDPRQPGYQNYGGKGIKVCEEWKSFEKFLADMGERPEGKTLDRIDGNGNYEKSNCRWFDMTEQANNRSNNHHLTYKCETHTVAQWAKILNIPVGTIRARLFRGFGTEDALKR